MSRQLVGGGAVRHVAWGIVGLALLGLFGCNPGEPGTDAGVDSGVPEVCVTAFPENVTAVSPVSPTPREVFVTYGPTKSGSASMISSRVPIR